MKTKPNVLVLKADGTNCDEELAYAFLLAGGNAKIVHINDLRSKKEKLNTYQILALPGGFSYGDDIVSGKILAVELTSFFSEELKTFITRKNTAVIGICNGFQVLVRTGLLPFGTVGKMTATLTNNDSGHFECRWINLTIEPKTKCVFLNRYSSSGAQAKSTRLPKTGTVGQGSSNETMKQSSNDILSFQVAHGEGKFFTDDKTLKKIEDQGLVAFRYVDDKGRPTSAYPANPNGSLHAIAGITDPSGRILGLMPHPERFVKVEQHPNWRRTQIKKPARNARASAAGGPQGLPIFENMIQFVKAA